MPPLARPLVALALLAGCPPKQGGPAPRGCGDGVLAGDEPCDDGNDDPYDGCDARCRKIGEWTYRHDAGGAINAVAVDATGRVIAAGFLSAPDGADMFLIVLAPDGTKVWDKRLPGAAGDARFHAVTVDGGGTIYAAGIEVTTPGPSRPMVRAFDRDGAELWSFVEPKVAKFATIADVAVVGGALISAGDDQLFDDTRQLVLRRHDLATGAAAWTTVTKANTRSAEASAVAAVGTELVVVGGTIDTNAIEHPLIAVFSGGGEFVSALVDRDRDARWSDVAPIGPDGDLVLVGRHARRIGPDLAERWTVTLDDNIAGVAVGPGQAIFGAGQLSKHEAICGNPCKFDPAAFGARLAPRGELLWTLVDDPEGRLSAFATSAASGESFVVMAGAAEASEGLLAPWIRQLKAR